MATDNMPISHWTSADIATTLEVFANKTQVYPDLRKSFGQGILTFDIIDTLKGRPDKFVASETFEVHEELPPFRTMTIGAAPSGGAASGDLITFVLDAGDVDQYFHYYPRAGQSFWAGSANLMVEMVIMSVTATGGTDGATITAYKKDSLSNTTWHPADYIKEGQTFPLSPAVNAGEGTAATTPTHTGYQHFDYYTQVLKDSLGWENAEFAREKWVEYDGIGLYNHEVARMDMNLDAAMESTIMFGDETTNTLIVQTSLATNATDVKVYGTKGIWGWITERGYTLDYTDTTDFTIEHFYELAEFGESVGLPASTWIFDSGGALLHRIEKSCKSYITNATGSLNEMFTPEAGGGMKDLTVGFKSIMIGGQNIILKPNYIMNNPYLFGISTLGLKDAAAVYPIGLARDGKTGEMIPNLELVYRGLGPYKDRKRVFAPFLGTGGPKGFFGSPVVLEGDISKIHSLVDFGVSFLDSWKCVRVVDTDYLGTV